MCGRLHYHYTITYVCTLYSLHYHCSEISELVMVYCSGAVMFLPKARNARYGNLCVMNTANHMLKFRIGLINAAAKELRTTP